MKYMFLFTLLLSIEVGQAKEELIVIQTVSVDQKSFVIAKGIKDGITAGQEVIFANENVSLVCKAIEVNRNYSYWYPVNTYMNVPFLREEIVSTNSHIYGSIGLELEADKNKLVETLDEKTDAKIEIENFRKQNHFSLRGSIGAGLSQTASSVSTSQNSSRYAYDLSLEYGLRMMPEFELGFGVRVDNDIYRLTNPMLDIPSTRYLALAIATYHFVNLSHGKDNAYLSLVGGIGTSKTVVNQATNSGYATVLPQIRLGYIRPFSKSNAIIFEVSVESISAKETLPDSTIQTSSYSNVKGTIGITF